MWIEGDIKRNVSHYINNNINNNHMMSDSQHILSIIHQLNKSPLQFKGEIVSTDMNTKAQYIDIIVPIDGSGRVIALRIWGYLINNKSSNDIIKMEKDVGLIRSLFKEDTSAIPCFFLHGNYNSRFFYPSWESSDDIASKNKFIFISIDRPGFGDSTLPDGMQLPYSATASDIVAIANYFGISKFCIMGYSSGGPHTAAVCCSPVTRGRVLSGALISSDPKYNELGDVDNVMINTYGYDMKKEEHVFLAGERAKNGIFAQIQNISKEPKRSLAIKDFETSKLMLFFPSSTQIV